MAGHAALMQISARPFRLSLPNVIGFALRHYRHAAAIFIELGGFGASLGNDCRPLQAIVPRLRGCWRAFRTAGHADFFQQPAKSTPPRPWPDAHPAKRLRSVRRATHWGRGPYGARIDRGEPVANHPRAYPRLPAETVMTNPAKRFAFLRHRILGDELAARGITHLSAQVSRPRSAFKPPCARANDRGFECLLAH